VLRNRLLLAAIAGLIVFAAVATALWYLDSTGGNSSTGSAAPSSAPAAPPAPTVVEGVNAKLVSSARLRKLAIANGQPIYWAGIRNGARLEYTRTRDGSTYIRYLTGGARPGSRGAGYIVVVTYAQPDAYRRVSAIARQKHLFVASLPNSGIAVTRPGRPQNMYVVYPKLPYQVEVYAPSAEQTRRLVFGGAIEPVR
jgi:hypothetical protein